ncbi:GNAT family N-acetyltransferase [Paenibacillus camelliae]|uniref:GNAT family N-acetyltransferase n=1 Tax=Paenibacillus camelliae TaxID=512410 RepID=UPI002040AAE7|nr:GNAT family N-acetyltransferase [Paenibacillus camelliae]MCM3634238.1 GNAT family N-acetyltransferase [Paenibacillus camelliae]
MQIRKAALGDIDIIMSIYDYARSFMKEQGNPDQWGDDYPERVLIEDDISQEKLYVCIDEEKVVGVFYYAQEEDPTYEVIKGGAWLNNEPYGVIHRIASAEGSRGVATFCLDWAFEHTGNIRIDTHVQNIPMQSLLKKLGYVYCGEIVLDDGTSRIAFQKVR